LIRTKKWFLDSAGILFKGDSIYLWTAYFTLKKSVLAGLAPNCIVGHLPRWQHAIIPREEKYDQIAGCIIVHVRAVGRYKAPVVICLAGLQTMLLINECMVFLSILRSCLPNKISRTRL
jgi:hypothetical protein